MFKIYKIPQEIEDQIFLYLDFETIEITREFQSDYVKQRTKTYSIKTAAKDGNLDEMVVKK
jgi:hypothetical protein